MNEHLDIDRQVAQAIPTLFASRGIDARIEGTTPIGNGAPDFWCRLSLDQHEIRLAVEVKGRWSQDILDQMRHLAGNDGEVPWLLFFPKLSSAVRKSLRQNRINHADLSGVLYLRAPGIRIDTDSSDELQVIRQSRPPRDINPFAKKASLILRALFAAPKEPIRISDLAARAGVAAGWASEVSDALVQRGYAENSASGIRLADPVSALRDWSAEYNWKKNPRRVFAVPFDYEQTAERLAKAFGKHHAQWALTLLAGAQRRIGHVRYSAMMHVYVRSNDSGMLDLALDELYAEETAGEGGLTVLEPYYGDAAFFGQQLMQGIPVVSDIQLFLDLAHFPVRGPEAATMLVQSRLGPALSLSANDTKRLLSDLL
jgi:hypothetical protein